MSSLERGRRGLDAILILFNDRAYPHHGEASTVLVMRGLVGGKEGEEKKRYPSNNFDKSFPRRTSKLRGGEDTFHNNDGVGRRSTMRGGDVWRQCPEHSFTPAVLAAGFNNKTLQCTTELKPDSDQRMRRA